MDKAETSLKYCSSEIKAIACEPDGFTTTCQAHENSKRQYYRGAGKLADIYIGLEFIAFITKLPAHLAVP
jgi:hypothetical protein